MSHALDTLFAVNLQRDKSGRIIEKTETIQGVTTFFQYQYDSRGRQFEVRRDSALYSRYTYDANGNRLARIVPGDTFSGTYDDQDRLSQYEGLIYKYSSHGELKSLISGGDTTRYAYDAMGNLISVRLPGGSLIEYVVDGKNRRVGKKVNGTLVQGFLYQGQLRLAAELDGSGNVVTRFIYASKSNVPDLMINAGVTYRIISDYLGSPRLVVNTINDSVVQRMEYDEFGNLLQNTNPGFQPFGFAGGLYDEHSGLTRFGARDYDSWSGRWITKDPIGFGGGDANLYRYVGNDPVNHTDPSGLWSVSVAGGSGFGGGFTFGVDDSGGFVEATLGIGSGAGITFNPFGSFSGKGNPCGGAGYVGIGVNVSGTVPIPGLGGIVGIGGSGNLRGALGYTTKDGKLTSAFSANAASVGFDGISPGIGVGVGAAGGVQLGYSFGSGTAGSKKECDCSNKP